MTVEEIIEISGEKIVKCMQCGKCSASCPASSEMEVLPHQVMRLLQVGKVDRILESQTVWQCASCFTCSSRCPRGIDVSKMMEAVRLTRIRMKGSSVLKADDVPSKVDDLMPQQAVVSAFRKYTK